mgnify:CR=1 FL=1
MLPRAPDNFLLVTNARVWHHDIAKPLNNLHKEKKRCFLSNSPLNSARGEVVYYFTSYQIDQTFAKGVTQRKHSVTSVALDKPQETQPGIISTS